MAKNNRALVKECVEYIEDNNKINELCDIFHEKLFALEPKMKLVLSDNEPLLRRKFFNMFSTFKAVKYIDKIVEEFVSMGARHKSYGMNDHYLDVMRKALFSSLSTLIGEKFNEYREAWEEVYTEVEKIFINAMKSPDSKVIKGRVKNLPPDFIDQIGGIDVIRRVHVKFYDIIFADKWLGEFFAGKEKESLITKQTQFMSMCFGGENKFKGETPSIAHMHMYLTEEMITLREDLLRKTILEEGLSQEICDKWLEVDHYFGSFLIKNSPDECVMKCIGQAPLVVKKPENYAPAL